MRAGYGGHHAAVRQQGIVEPSDEVHRAATAPSAHVTCNTTHSRSLCPFGAAVCQVCKCKPLLVPSHRVSLCLLLRISIASTAAARSERGSGSALRRGKVRQHGDRWWHVLGALRRECVRSSACHSASGCLTASAALQARRRCSRSCSVWSPPWASWTSAWRVSAACIASPRPHHNVCAELTHHAPQTCGRRRAPSLSTAWSCPLCLAASSRRSPTRRCSGCARRLRTRTRHAACAVSGPW